VIFVAESDQHYSLASIARSVLTIFSVAEGDEQKNDVIVAHFQRAKHLSQPPGDSRRAIMSVAFSDRKQKFSFCVTSVINLVHTVYLGTRFKYLMKICGISGKYKLIFRRCRRFLQKTLFLLIIKIILS